VFFYLYSKYGNSLLHYAIKANNIKLLFYLVKNGCKLSITNKEHKRPIDIAIQMGNKDLYSYISKLENYTSRSNIVKESTVKGDLQIINFNRTEEEDDLKIKKTKKAKLKKSKTEEVDLIPYLKEKFNYNDKIKESLNYTKEIIKDKSFTLKSFLCKSVEVKI
jgi:hypothetical protein